MLIYPAAHPQAQSLVRVWTAVYLLNVGAKLSSTRSRGRRMYNTSLQGVKEVSGCISDLFT